MKDFDKEASQYFETVSKNENDLMASSKNYALRVRMGREIDFNEDFRKRFMTREYGNYEKYEGKNNVAEEVDRGVNDTGLDTFYKNHNQMMKSL